MTIELNATVTRREEINHGLLVLQVTPDFELPEFKAGQYAVLGLPSTAPRIVYADPEPEEGEAGRKKLIRRAYSVSSSSLHGEYLEFYIALVHSGALTPRIFALEVGDRIFLGKKIVGMFTLDDVPPDNDLLFVATGTGLAPYVSMLRSAYRFHQRKTIVIHAARTSRDLGYRRELEALATYLPDFHYLPIIDEIERDPGWKGPVGFVYHYFDDGTVEKLLGYEFEPGRLSVFLCGNPLMIEGMEKLLVEKGFTKHSRKQPGDVFIEEFWKD
jgi:ferredoxin--NADP+ reductase